PSGRKRALPSPTPRRWWGEARVGQAAAHWLGVSVWPRQDRRSRYLRVMMLLAALLPVCGPTAEAAFTEGAPVDRFEIVDHSPEGWRVTEVVVDLGPSTGRLIVDAVPGGIGINVAQPFRPESGGPVRLAPGQEVADGAERIALSFEAFPVGARFGFTLDLDDRVSGGAGTMIAGGEMAGATLSVRFVHAEGGEEVHDGLFGVDAGRSRSGSSAGGRGAAAARAGAPCLG
ncbi:MAG: hypothetical protein AAGF76_17575, partial [Pseudomonadota bacterium]